MHYKKLNLETIKDRVVADWSEHFISLASPLIRWSSVLLTVTIMVSIFFHNGLSISGLEETRIAFFNIFFLLSPFFLVFARDLKPIQFSLSVIHKSFFFMISCAISMTSIVRQLHRSIISDVPTPPAKLAPV